MQPRFAWRVSFADYIEFEVTDDSGTYRVEMRQRPPSAYWLKYANGDDVRRDMHADLGLLRRCGCGDNPARLFEVSAATVDAFNAWRLAEHHAHMARLDAEPDRYGFIPADDPLRAPPLVAWRGFYVIGQGWQHSDPERDQAHPAAVLADLYDLVDALTT
jgi:hypothetical protein